MFGMFGALYVAHSGAQVTARQAMAAASRSGLKAGEVMREMKILTERLDKLILINMAMWSLIEAKTGVTEEELIQRVQEIDLRDGVPDGKVTRMAKKCGNCGRTVSQRHSKCLFCGSEALSDTPFEGV